MNSAGAGYVMRNLPQSVHRAWTIFSALSAHEKAPYFSSGAASSSDSTILI
jgi:hypothetical protein